MPSSSWAFTLLGSDMLLASAVLLAAGLASHAALRRLRSANIRSTIDAFAELAAAGNDGTRMHLERVRLLAAAVGKRLGLDAAQLEALEAAAQLHDLGKLGVPERILSKPGRLDRDEMDQVRIHPDLAADILGRLPGAREVAAIVRHHHEQWDGSGYPAGLRGDGIPLGARILAVVDNYDALTSNRPYRSALPHIEAIGFLKRETGRMFDGLVVDALIACLAERPEWIAAIPALSATAEESEEVCSGATGGLSRARLELKTLYEIARARDYGLDLEEFLTLVASKLGPLVPFRSLAVYRFDGEAGMLRACFATGQAAEKLRLTSIVAGERLSGWTALHRRAHRAEDHRSPLDRDGFRSDLEDWAQDERMRELRSAIAAPLIVRERCVGVLTLYDRAERGFDESERRILVRVAARLAQAVEQAAGRTPGDTSLTDPSTGVPNARFLWLETAHRIACAAETASGFGLLAFRVLGLERVTERLGDDDTDRLLGRIARRFAGACAKGDTLVRFGPDLFVVLTASSESGELVRRWHALAIDVEQPLAIAPGGPVHQVRLRAAHAAFPEDGGTLEELLETLDERLMLSAGERRTIVPFKIPAAL